MAKKKAETPKQRKRRLRKAWGLIKLDAKGRELLRVHLEHPDMSQGDLAAVIGFTREAVNRRMRQPVFMNAVAEANLEALEKLERLRKRSIDRIGELMEQDEDKQVALRAALFVARPVQPTGVAGDDVRNFTEFLIAAYDDWERIELEEMAKKEALDVVPVHVDAAT